LLKLRNNWLRHNESSSAYLLWTLVRHPIEPKPVLPLDPARVIEILVDVIHHPKDDAKATARRLSARGLAVTPEHVEAVLGGYGVKKTVRSRLRRSRY
jgi:hypothetical protein